MKALVTLEDGQMFCIDTRALHVVSMNERGIPVCVQQLEQPIIAIPGHPFACAFGNGIETQNAKVATVIYSA